MRKPVLIIVLLILSGFLISIPRITRGDGGLKNDVEYVLVNLKKKLGKIKADDIWEFCGSYLTSQISGDKDTVYFNIEDPDFKKNADDATGLAYVFTRLKYINIIFDENSVLPTITKKNDGVADYFLIRMNLKEFLASPCIAKMGARV